MDIREIQDILKTRYPSMEVVPIAWSDLVFEQRVRLKCFQCRNYRTKWTCPGNLPQFDFPKMIGEYEHAAVVIYKHAAADSRQTENEYKQAGNELHRAMLFLESELMKHNNPMAQSFIGGSCELCKNGCPKEACAHPDQARIPWDATGCNVTRSLANIGIQVDFTGKDNCRYGLLVW